MHRKEAHKLQTRRASVHSCSQSAKTRRADAETCGANATYNERQTHLSAPPCT